MTEDGKVGFGHLRYQEYLAALEIQSNRAINIIEYMDQEWWRGVLVFSHR
jgi:hypothetical protein